MNWNFFKLTVSLNSLKLLFILGFIASISFFSPGIFSNDSLYQLNEAQKHIYTSMHAPIMSILMHYLYYIYQESGLFYLHQLIYWLVSYFFFTFIFDKRYWWLPLLPLCPITYLLTLTVWKDTQMVLCLFGAVTAILYWLYQRRATLFFLIVALLLYAFWVRSNAVFAVVPIALFLIHVILVNKKLTFVKHCFFSFVLLFTTISIAFLARNMIYERYAVKTVTPLGYILIWDVSNIKHELNKTTEPLPNFIKCYDVEKCKDWVINHSLAIPYTCWTGAFECNVTNKVESSKLISWWLDNVKNNPSIYLKNRFKTASIAWFGYETSLPYHSYQQNNYLGGRFRIGYLGTKILDSFYFIQKIMQNLYIYQYGGYFIISLFVIFYIIILKIKRKMKFKTPATTIAVFVLAILISGLLNSIPLIFLAGAEYRYYIWSILTVLLSCLILYKYRVEMLSFKPKLRRTERCNEMSE